MKTIALIDPFPSGHHLTYLKIYARTILELGCKVFIFSPKADDVAAWINREYSPLSNRVFPFVISTPEEKPFFPTRLRPTLTAIKLWQEAGKVVQRAANLKGHLPDLVFFLWLDSYLNNYLPIWYLNRVFPFPWSGLYFHATHLRLRPNWAFLKKSILDPDHLLIAKHCHSVAALDEGIVGDLRKKIRPREVFWLPDIADESIPPSPHSLAIQIRNLARGRKVVGLLGVSKRKGMMTLLEVAKQMVHEPFFFVFAGRYVESSFDAGERAYIIDFISKNLDNCLFALTREPIPDEASFNSILQAFDIFYVGYHKFFGSSNMVAKAAFLKKYLIASAGYCVAERVEKYRLGLTVAEGDVNCSIKALERLGKGMNWEGEPLHPNYEAFVKIFSQTVLARALKKLVRTI